MKKLLVFALFLSAVLLAGLFWQEHPVAQGGPVAPPKLPATGQDQDSCKDKAGNFDDCAECPSQDGGLRRGCPMVDRFVILPGPNGEVDPADPDDPIPAVDDTVFDRCTGLEWQRGSADTNNDQAYTTTQTNFQPCCVFEPDDGLEWSEALTYCEDLTYAGHDDWRLPNATELQSIVDYGGAGTGTLQLDQTLIDDAFILAKYLVHANMQSTHWTSTSRPACSTGSNGRCIVDPPDPDPVPDSLHAIYVGFNSSQGGSTGRAHETFSYPIFQLDDPTVYLVRAVRRGTINAAAGGGAVGRGGADGDRAERGGGAGPQACVDDNGNINGDVDRDLSDAISLLAWLFQGGDPPVPFCTTPGPKADGCAVENGNINGDVDRDLSDAISLLAWLFQGGPEPVAPCPDLAAPEICTGGVDEDLDGDIDCADADCVFEPICDITMELPTTGVTSCYNKSGATTTCAEAETLGLGGQDGAYQAGGCITGPARFVRNEPGGPDDVNSPVDDTVTDMCTGLEWLWQRADTNGDGKIGLDDNPMTPGFNENDNLPWCEAVAYANDTLDFAGKTDWRFPNVHEAYSLMAYGLPAVYSGKLIDPAFGGTGGETTSTIGDGTNVFNVLYGAATDGIDSGSLLPTAEHGIRAVRNADP